MPRVLVISPYFPPRRRVGALRAFRFATHLADLGHDVGVVHLDTPTETLTPLEARRLETIARFPLRAPFDATERPSRAAARDSGARRTSEWIDARVPVDTWAPFFAASASRVRRFTRAFAPDVVFSTADPWSSHLLGYVASRASGSPWIADFRDPWTLCDVRPRGRPAWTRRADRFFEARVLSHADVVTFTAEATSSRYAEAYPWYARRIRTVENAFDSAMMGAAAIPCDGRAVSRDGTLRILFFGAFRPLSPAAPIVEAIFELHRAHPALVGRVQVGSMGALPPADAALARRLGVEGAFTALSSVPYESALACLRASDVLLLSTEPRRDEIIPAKLWDYLPALRPILNLSPCAEAHEVLARTGLGVTERASDAVAIARRLAACVRAMDEGAPLPLSFAPDLARVAEHDAPNVTKKLEGIIESLLEARGAA